ncbi:hypothetical protein GDO78_015315 [Eleutherodactylus coqui]|uniref:Ig-like domain-containing protein n=1 Tax=Eleutherodactylus coqui TaxID=57060 RepID=A0A8J6JWM8_ELECQ|nr:hypothetical protein GDO78_015315 [Eleutherodactylus coqui]
MCAGTWGAVVFLDTCVILCTVFSTENITLSLSQVSPSDEGVYDCNIFLKKAREHELVYTEQLVLSIWANYTKPQIFFRSFDAVHTAVCSSNGGFPMGDVKWILSSNNLDIRNMTETLAEKNPKSMLYNISGRLTLPPSATGSIYCCVEATDQRVCSDETELPQTEKPRNGKGETRRNTVLICLSLMIALAISMLQLAGAHVYTGRAQ